MVRLFVIVHLSVGCMAYPGCVDAVPAAVSAESWSSHRGDCGNTGCGGARGSARKISWRAYVSKGSPSEAIVSRSGVVLISIRDADFVTRLFAVDKVSGKVRWAKTIGTEETIWPTPTPAADELGNVYVATYDGRLIAFRCSNGKQLWRFTPERTPSRPRQFVVSSPKVFGTMVYAAFGGYMYAVDRATGKQRWRVKASMAPTYSPAFSRQGRMYVPSSDLLALNPSTGKVLWRLPMKPVGAGGSPMCVGDRVYVQSCSGYSCVDAIKGKVIWSTSDPRHDLSQLAWCRGTSLYGIRRFLGDGRLLAIDKATGKLSWTYSPLPGYADPCTDDAGVVYAVMAPKIAAVDTAKRKVKWAVDLGLDDKPPSYSSPSIGPDGTIYIADGAKGVLYAVR